MVVMHPIKLCKKPNPRKQRTQKQIEWQEKFKEADCIYFKLTPQQKAKVREWNEELNKIDKKNYSPYSRFMSAILKNNLPELLEGYFCTTLDELKLTETDTYVEISTYITYRPQEEEFEGWFERITRRS